MKVVMLVCVKGLALAGAVRDALMCLGCVLTPIVGWRVKPSELSEIVLYLGSDLRDWEEDWEKLSQEAGSLMLYWVGAHSVASSS